MSAPLTPPGCDLRDFDFMTLDVRRLLKSETWMEAADDPRLGHALMTLWAESWHQVPAASVPNNDRLLARLAMCSAGNVLHIFRTIVQPGKTGASHEARAKPPPGSP